MRNAIHDLLLHILHKDIRKVPEITIYFWIVKLLTTAMGESTSDYFVFHFNPYMAVVVSGIMLFASIVLQLWVRKYIAWIYWFAIVMVAIFGTMAADVMHVVMGIPYVVSSTIFAIILLIIFIVWYQCEKTLSIHSIYTFRRELFYWVTVMATFALGTAAGDMTAATLHLGYFASGILFLVLFLLPTLYYWKFKRNEVFTFWFAYIMTRPLGASFADWFGKPYLGGLGFGDAKVSILLTLCIIGFVAYLGFTKIDVKR